jgi:hypothetical protein
MANKFKEKQMLAENLNDLYSSVEDRERNVRNTYAPIGEEQETDWRTGELKWEDEEQTIPKMTKKWDYVPKNEEDFDEDDLIRLKVCQYIKSQLEKMI